MHICVYTQIGNLEGYYHFELPVSGSEYETAARRSINPTSGTGLRPEITQAIKNEENVCHYLANLQDQNSPVCLHITQFKPNTMRYILIGPSNLALVVCSVILLSIMPFVFIANQTINWLV